MPANKTCPRCGARFQCLHSADCWCATISLNEKARRELATRYHDCLCRECLTAIAAGSPGNTGSPVVTDAPVEGTRRAP